MPPLLITGEIRLHKRKLQLAVAWLGVTRNKQPNSKFSKRLDFGKNLLPADLRELREEAPNNSLIAELAKLTNEGTSPEHVCTIAQELHDALEATSTPAPSTRKLLIEGSDQPMTNRQRMVEIFKSAKEYQASVR